MRSPLLETCGNPTRLSPTGAEPREKRVVRVLVDTSYRKMSVRSCFPFAVAVPAPRKDEGVPIRAYMSEFQLLALQGGKAAISQLGQNGGPGVKQKNFLTRPARDTGSERNTGEGPTPQIIVVRLFSFDD